MQELIEQQQHYDENDKLPDDVLIHFIPSCIRFLPSVSRQLRPMTWPRGTLMNEQDNGEATGKGMALSNGAPVIRFRAITCEFSAAEGTDTRTMR